MRKSIVISMVVAALVGLLALTGVASAGSPHFAGGKDAKPAFTDLGTDLTTTVDVAGLGNFDTVLNVTANGTASGTSTCTNKGGTPAPGQNPASFPVTATGTIAVPAGDIKNGRVQISVTSFTSPLTFTIPLALDCANPNWTETVTITDVAWTNATVAISQVGQGVVLSATCAFSPATSNGPVPKGSLSC